MPNHQKIFTGIHHIPYLIQLIILVSLCYTQVRSETETGLAKTVTLIEDKGPNPELQPISGTSGFTDTSRMDSGTNLSKDSSLLLQKSWFSKNFRPYIGLQAAVEFAEFKQQSYFDNDVNQYMSLKVKNDSARFQGDTTQFALASQLLEKYQPTPVLFPLGIHLGMKFKDIIAIDLKTNHMYYSSKALISNRVGKIATTTAGKKDSTIQSSTANQEFTFYSSLFGLSLKLYLPTEFININSKESIYIGMGKYFDLGFSELYSGNGSTRFKKRLNPMGTEYYIGYQIKTFKTVVVEGNLLYATFAYDSDDSWSAVLLQDINEKIQWESKGLMFNFQIHYYL